ncbi:MAG: crossover junction endodeoxyribonuclease RuvC [Flavobacteriaceae bacterium]|nr:crossover junction endodeoxyribonuclease RuvC [Flavobacteriaceae bacterium]
MQNRVILGIDPGTNVMGYGAISCNGSKVTLLSLGVIKLDKEPNHPLKLKAIFEQVTKLMENYKPDEVALEAPFFGENVQSMLKLGRAQGVAMAAALVKDIPIFEYAPRKVKMSIAGSGNASKEQVAAMLKNLLKIEALPKYLDATDGLAVAYCHFMQNNVGNNIGGKKANGWAGFLKDNPGRLK